MVPSVISSLAFLEAMVNELFQDATDRHHVTDDGYLAPLDASQLDIACGLRGWMQRVSRGSWVSDKGEVP